MIHQSMSAKSAQIKIDHAAQSYGALIRDEKLSLKDAQIQLTDVDTHHMNLFEIAGLAKAIACFQCSAD